MPKYWGKQILSLGSFPEVGQNEKTEKERKRPKVGNNNGQLRIATPPRVAHTKPPGPKSLCIIRNQDMHHACNTSKDDVQ